MAPHRKVTIGLILFVVGCVINILKLPNDGTLYYSINMASKAFTLVGTSMVITGYIAMRRQ